MGNYLVLWEMSKEDCMEILWLGESHCHDPSIVGGKAANLSLLTASHRVPPGFALTVEAFDQANGRGFSQDIATSRGQLIPESLNDLLVSAYRKLCRFSQAAEISVAVRSSALDEDGSTASFAGQHNTFLNIVGEQAVADAIAQCWRSVYNPHALEYRRHEGLPVDDLKIAVLVQQLIPSDVSAVIFSANPLTGSSGEVMINVSWGLGESIVGGTVTPDTYVVRKEDMTVLATNIGEKTRMTVHIPGGTQEVGVPRLMRKQPSVTGEQAIEMAQLAVDLEKKMGWPTDIECAYYRGQLYLLQCRPITTLPSIHIVESTLFI